MTWLLSLALMLCWSGPSLPEPARAAILQGIENGDNAGAIVGLVDAKGEVSYAGFGGVRYRPDGTPEAAPDAHTLFEIGSITKVFTSLVLATMVLDGTVALEDPVAKYLPAGVT